MITVVTIPENLKANCDGCNAPAAVAVKDPKTSSDPLDANLFLCHACQLGTIKALDAAVPQNVRFAGR